MTPAAAAFAKALAAAPGDSAPGKIQGLMGLAQIGPLAVPALELERLAEAVRVAPRRAGGCAVLSEAARRVGPLGLAAPRAGQVLRALGFAPIGRREFGQPMAWRRRRTAAAALAQAAPASPFAALAVLEPAGRASGARRQAAGALVAEEA